MASTSDTTLTLVRVERESELPGWATRAQLETFLHETMKPWQDPLEQVHKAVDDCWSPQPGRGGFMILAAREGRLAGVCVMLRTGMGGYVPEWLLLMISVDPRLRGQGIGEQVARRALAEAGGAVKLHVEYENPARHLYERLGFHSKYAEMRYAPTTA
jgi:ribosomal-protein-alanine N-acetyltransferase